MRLRRTWDNLRSSYWSLPILISVLSGGLAIGALALDERVRYIVLEGWVYSGGPPRSSSSSITPRSRFKYRI